MFALAHNVGEAGKLVLKFNDGPSVRNEIIEKPEIFDMPVGFAVFGGG